MEQTTSEVEIPFYKHYDVHLSRREAIRAFFGKRIRTGRVSPVIELGVGTTSTLITMMSGAEAEARTRTVAEWQQELMMLTVALRTHIDLYTDSREWDAEFTRLLSAIFELGWNTGSLAQLARAPDS